MGIADIPKFLRDLDRLLHLEDKHGTAIDRLAHEIADLKSRIIRLENREDIIIAEAKGAAHAAASQVAMTSLADLARRVGGLEERSNQFRLPPASA
jgi:hypothetical protein